MKKNTKETLHNIFLVCLLGIFVFGFIQIWNVTTFHSGYEITHKDGHTTWVGPTFEIDVAKLIRKFISNNKEEKKNHKKCCDDNFSSSIQNSLLEHYVSGTMAIEHKSRSGYGTVLLIDGDHVIGRKKIWSPTKPLWTAEDQKRSEEYRREHWKPTKPISRD